MATVEWDYYAVLHVSRDAPAEIVRSSYRTLMQKLKHHPDLGGDAATAALINEAYAVLSDARRRAEYDAYLFAASQVRDGVLDGRFADSAAAAPVELRNPLRECVFCETPHAHGRNIEKEAACRSCDSPLWPVKPQRLEETGKRAVERVYKAQPITYYTHARQVRGFAGQTENISPQGLRFATRNELEEGQYVRIVSEFLDTVSQVTHCNYERQGWEKVCLAGVAFVTLRFVRPLGGFVSRRV